MKIIIVGGGISGLVAGVYARKAGFEADIYEAHSVVGGLCTGWQRGGYNIDGCVDWLTGSKPGTEIYRIWETCGVIGPNVQVAHQEVIISCLHNGSYYHLYADPDRMEREFAALSPDDAPALRTLAATIRAFQRLPVPASKPMEMMSLWEKIQLGMPYIRAGKYMLSTSRQTIGQYVAQFRHPVIRTLLAAAIPCLHFAANALIFTLATYASGDAGRPLGGSLAMAQRVKERFEELGGTVHLQQPVKRIAVANGKATGVETDGGVAEADYVISAISEDVLLQRLLGGQLRDPYFEKRCAAPESYPSPAASLVSFGFGAALRNRPHSLYVPLDQPLHIGQMPIHGFNIRHYGGDPTFSADNKTVVAVTLCDTEYDYWRSLKNGAADDYRRAKDALANGVLAKIEAVYPELKGTVQVIDVATPLTFERYCATRRGAYMSFNLTPTAGYAAHKGTLPGLKNLYLAGQWVMPSGGLPIAAIAGKFAVQRICKNAGKA